MAAPARDIYAESDSSDDVCSMNTNRGYYLIILLIDHRIVYPPPDPGCGTSPSYRRQMANGLT